MSTVTEYGNATVVETETAKISILRTGDVIVERPNTPADIYLSEIGTPMSDAEMALAVGIWQDFVA
jgi:hypothetical protein